MGIQVLWQYFLPILILSLASVILALLGIFAPKKIKLYKALAYFSVILSALSATYLWVKIDKQKSYLSLFSGHLYPDLFSYCLQIAMCVFAFFSLIFMFNRGIDNSTAFYKDNFLFLPLFLMCLCGALTFVMAGDFITAFVALELMSLPLYLLTSLARSNNKNGTSNKDENRKKSIEASIKYFLLGSVASAIFLFGAALVYGATDSLDFNGVWTALGEPTQMDPILFVGVVLVLIGLLFKVGAVPFHFWVADVYDGAPTPITGFMSSVIKIAGFGALIRVALVAFAPLDLRTILSIVAAATIIIGTFLALKSTNAKRMLAYSSINHCGFALIGIVAFSSVGITNTMFYLITYGFSAIGSFGILWIIRTSKINKRGEIYPSLQEDPSIMNLEGFGRQNPLLAGALTVFLFSFAGLPLTGGFIAKLGILMSGANANIWWLVVVGIACSVIAVYFYGSIVYKMFFCPVKQSITAVAEPTEISAVIAICILAIIVIFLGIVPSVLLDFCAKSAFLFV